MSTIEGPTPNGGVRSDITYLDADGTITTNDRAVEAVIRELDEDDVPIFETRLVREPRPAD